VSFRRRSGGESRAGFQRIAGDVRFGEFFDDRRAQLHAVAVGLGVAAGGCHAAVGGGSRRVVRATNG
jgi:hypothetical protein